MIVGHAVAITGIEVFITLLRPVVVEFARDRVMAFEKTTPIRFAGVTSPWSRFESMADREHDLAVQVLKLIGVSTAKVRPV